MTQISALLPLMFGTGVYPQMQLTALSHAAHRSEGSSTLGRLPPPRQALMISLVLVARAALELWFGCSSGATKALGILAAWLLVTGGIGNLVGAAACEGGTLYMQPGVSTIVVFWLGIRIALDILLGVVVVVGQFVQFGTALTCLLVLLVVLLDIWLLFCGIELLFSTVLDRTVHPSTVVALIYARRIARESCEPCCSRDHLLIALLRDVSIGAFLRGAGSCDVPRVSEALRLSLPKPTGPQGWVSYLPPAGEQVIALLEAASRLQWELHDERLTGHHLLAAFCTDGSFSVPASGGPGAARFAVNAAALNRFLQDAADLAERGRRAKSAPSPEPDCGQDGDSTTHTERQFQTVSDRMLGCVPLEPAVAFYALARAVQCVFALFGFPIYAFVLEAFGGGHGPASHLTWGPGAPSFELFMHTLGVATGSLAYVGVSRHRDAREAIINAAATRGCIVEIWEQDLPQAYDLVRSVEPEAARWVETLRRSTTWLALFLGWAIAEVFLNIPLFGVRLVYGNVCGAYIRGVSSFAHGLWHADFPQCSAVDGYAIDGFLAWEAWLVFAFWITSRLWIHYAYGRSVGYSWRDVESLEMLFPLGAKLTRTLAGMPPPKDEDESVERQPLLAKLV